MNVMQFILYFIGELYAQCSIFYGYSKLRLKPSFFTINYKKILIILIATLLLLINNLYNLSSYRTLMSFFIMFLSNYIYFKDNIKDTLITTIIFIFINTMFELIFSALLLTSFKNIEDLNTNGTFMKIFFTIFIFTISNIFFSRVKVINILNKLKKIALQIFSLEFILILVLIILNIMTFTLGTDMKNTVYIISIGIGIIYILITLLTIAKKQYNIEKLKAKNIELENSYKAYSKALDDFRTLRHNLKNDLYSIKGIIPADKEILVNNLITKYNSQYEWINTLDKIPEGLEGIIYLKKNEAEKAKVKMHINYKSTSKIKDKDFLDICDTLGILLDNAIEASKMTNKKIITLDVSENETHIIMKVINPFTNKININKIGTKNYSTKERKSGIGLNYLNNINNKNISTNISIVNNLFISTIYYKK